MGIYAFVVMGVAILVVIIAVLAKQIIHNCLHAIQLALVGLTQQDWYVQNNKNKRKIIYKILYQFQFGLCIGGRCNCIGTLST